MESMTIPPVFPSSLSIVMSNSGNNSCRYRSPSVISTRSPVLSLRCIVRTLPLGMIVPGLTTDRRTCLKNSLDARGLYFTVLIACAIASGDILIPVSLLTSAITSSMSLWVSWDSWEISTLTGTKSSLAFLEA